VGGFASHYFLKFIVVKTDSTNDFIERDVVKIIEGKYKGQQAEILKVSALRAYIATENMQLLIIYLDKIELIEE
jgi:transcription antitermination factor NusG